MYKQQQTNNRDCHFHHHLCRRRKRSKRKAVPIQECEKTKKRPVPPVSVSKRHESKMKKNALLPICTARVRLPEALVGWFPYERPNFERETRGGLGFESCHATSPRETVEPTPSSFVIQNLNMKKSWRWESKKRYIAYCTTGYRSQAICRTKGQKMRCSQKKDPPHYVKESKWELRRCLDGVSTFEEIVCLSW